MRRKYGDSDDDNLVRVLRNGRRRKYDEDDEDLVRAPGNERRRMYEDDDGDLGRRRRRYEDDDDDLVRVSRNERGRKDFDQRLRDEEENVASWKDCRREAREKDYDYEDREALGRERYAKYKNESYGRNVDRGESSKAFDKRWSEIDKRVVGQEVRKYKNDEDLVRVSRNEIRRNEFDRKIRDKEENIASLDRERYSEYRNESRRINVDRGESSTSFDKRQSEIDKRVVAQADSRNSSLRAGDVERLSNLQGRYDEGRMKDREERLSSVNFFSQVTRDERIQNDQNAVDKVEISEQYGTNATDSRYRVSDTEGANNSKTNLEISRDDEISSSSHRHFEEERVKHKEDKSSSVENSVRMRINEVSNVNQQSINQQYIDHQYINQKYENRSNSSKIHASSTERDSNSKNSLRIRADDREQHLTSNLVCRSTDESRVESQLNSSVSEFRRDEERVSDLQQVATIRPENERETSSSVMIHDERDNRQKSNLIEESSSQVKGDAMDSASRYDESSAMYLGEFVDKLWQERLALESSELHMGEFVEKLRQEKLALESSKGNKGKTHRETYKEMTAADVDVDDDITRHGVKYIEESGRKCSSRPAMKGPSDEMWEVKGMSSQEPSEIEGKQEEDTEKEPLVAEVVDSNISPGIAESVISRRSHKSLWAYIADIMKIGWAHRAGSQSSVKKSGRSSSNVSTSSEAWFEPDETHDETEKEKDVSQKAPLPSKNPTENASTSTSTVKRGSSSSFKSVSAAEEIELRESEKIRGDTLSSETITEQSLIPTINTASSSLCESGGFQMQRSNAPESEEVSGRQKQLEATEIGESYRGLKKRNDSLKESTPTMMNVEQSNLGPSGSMETMRRASSLKGVSLVSREEVFKPNGGDKGQGVVSAVDESSVSTAKTTPPSMLEIESVQNAGGRLQKLEEITEIGGTEGELNRRKLQKNKKVLRGQFDDWEEGVVSAVNQSSVLTAKVTPPLIPETGSVEIAGSGLHKLEEITEGEKLPEVTGTEGQLRGRKLQRNKQVLREQFDEWEEAYKLESEQRKMDEFFMREALLEAKKAADTWEVPVGAVLVQNGKIIARGCNLVEEMRDSTAHAEMICIREASNLLRTWRLAETTLYVTLEPCAMCAGAILQARVDTVVWGAPNKLLGADGSWVRLFPGDVGTSSLDSSNQSAGPVHPFHPKIRIRRGILATECADVMQQFFQLRRKKNKKEQQPSPPSWISTRPHKFFARMHDVFSVMFCL
ncbi:tRNA(adenine(34)) deaminase, chloroplastic [Asparagus officinalis]|uniref:tRNA(adenine(34)) deaminase n=1 Tax=Asparagus officinalis TaxID=4686 RepID=A0A5P1FSP5_ASPOF|nr:tRNA(adenine(34)) deaminase, chloroplastic [Asparagus officinalis]ONK81336.1 tRNA(adenine(34)) deaminase, chloroplastic [Asparagus officinalis]